MKTFAAALLLALALICAIPGDARAALGEDEAACIKRYGPYTERGTVNRKADYTLHWERKDRIITAAFVNGKCEMVTHAMKENAGELPDEDIEAALKESSNGGTLEWKLDNPQRNWLPRQRNGRYSRSDNKASAMRIGDMLIISSKDYLDRRPRS